MIICIYLDDMEAASVAVKQAMVYEVQDLRTLYNRLQFPLLALLVGYYLCGNVQGKLNMLEMYVPVNHFQSRLPFFSGLESLGKTERIERIL